MRGLQGQLARLDKTQVCTVSHARPAIDFRKQGPRLGPNDRQGYQATWSELLRPGQRIEFTTDVELHPPYEEEYVLTLGGLHAYVVQVVEEDGDADGHSHTAEVIKRMPQ